MAAARDLLGSWSDDETIEIRSTTPPPTQNPIPSPPSNSMSDVQKEINALQFDILQKQIDSLHQTVTGALNLVGSTVPVVKPLIKPRDIPILQLRQLRGEEGEGRIGVFFSQVEQCSQAREERIKIVQSRVDAQLAVYIQAVLNRDPYVAWSEFVEYLTKELTDQNENKLFDAINDLTYTFDQEPVEFMNQVRCKFALLSLKNVTGDVPNQDKLIKRKLVKGMPQENRERLEMFLDNNVSLPKFLEKLEIERLIALTRSKERVGQIHSTSPIQVSSGGDLKPTSNPPGDGQDVIRKLEQRIKQLEAAPPVQPTRRNAPSSQNSYNSRNSYTSPNAPNSQNSYNSRNSYTSPNAHNSQNSYNSRTSTSSYRRLNTPFCPYCRTNNHSIRDCRKNPKPGSCFDCLQLNCRRGHPQCPGRKSFSR